MKRIAEVIFKADDGKRCIAIDVLNKDLIINFLSDKNQLKKFDLICKTILRGIKNTDLYDKEDINGKCHYVTAMKFKSKQNTRIYCKEQRNGDKTLIIIAAELLEKKKNQKNQQREISLIQKVAGYEYEIHE